MFKVKRTIFVFCILGIAACALLFIPQVRGLIISFGEQVITHRKLQAQVWHEKILLQAIIGAIFFVIVLCSLSSKFKNIINSFFTLCGKHTLLRYTILLLPVIFGFIIVTVFGVNVIDWDEWDLALFINGVKEHGIKLQEFFTQHNEHPIFFPKIVFLLSALCTHFNTKANMYISLILNVTIYCTLLNYLRHTLQNKNTQNRKLAADIFMGFCCFNLIQYGNFLWGFQLAFFMVACFSLLSFYFFYYGCKTKKTLFFVVAGISGIISAFSSVQGFFALPVILFIMALLKILKENIKLKHFLCILISFAIVLFLYLLTYRFPSFNNTHYASDLLRSKFLYFFIAQGAPIRINLLPPFKIALTAFSGMTVFLTAVLLTIYLIKKKQIQNNIFPLCIIYFGILFCMAISAGRSVFGLSQALISRYTTFTIQIIIGIVLIVTTNSAIWNKNIFKIPIAKYAILITTLSILLQNTSIVDVIDYANMKRPMRDVILDYKRQPLEEIAKSFPWGDLDSAYKYINIVEKKQLVGIL
ncbi:MAG: hypothetical protein Ta2F_05970 [Termitinemataceae bacterium]|nr:MAG: hypothetical protein Ta2F_05970 [Termitinemataceae bacterium]